MDSESYQARNWGLCLLNKDLRKFQLSIWENGWDDRELLKVGEQRSAMIKTMFWKDDVGSRVEEYYKGEVEAERY